MIENNVRNNTRKSSFQRIREDVHSPFLIKGNYYNGEREVEETRILIDTSVSCNHMQANKFEMIGNIKSLYVFKNYDDQTIECNLNVEIPIRLQGIVTPHFPGVLLTTVNLQKTCVSHIMRPIHE